MTIGVSWGLVRARNQRVVSVHDRAAPLSFSADTTYLAFGNGRSYGDCCLNDDGTLLSTRGLDRFIEFDPVQGTLTCEAGVLLSEAIALIAPQGWFLEVTPGTQFVTIGGAIANDVHGKNHHHAGAFGCHVEELALARSSGEVLRCSRTNNPELFSATISGLGLTGLILWARFRLKKLKHPAITGEVVTFRSVQEFLDLSAKSDAAYEYTVAWIDCFARGRGVLSRGNHVEADKELADKSIRSINQKYVPAIPIVRRAFVQCFNSAYFRWHQMRTGRRTWDFQSYLYPLDSLRDWNRLYGKNGLYQHQSVVPTERASEVLAAMLARITNSKEGSMLTVLKVLGARTSGGLMSFPRAGVTMAIDFANRGASTLRLLKVLDEIVVEAGGALYPAKDARMSPECFRASFPRIEEFQAHVDPWFSSTLWRRVAQ